MAADSKIEWCDYTFNAWAGCTNVSPACDHCYAERDTARYKFVEWGPHAQRRKTSPATWAKPYQWQRSHEKFFSQNGRRQRVFANSWSDVFDNAAPQEWRNELFHTIHMTPDLDWLLLTKRPQNMAGMLPYDWGDGWPNVWLGVTVENQQEADRRIPILMSTPAAVRFLSCEPLLGPVDVERWLKPIGIHCLDICLDAHYVKPDELSYITNSRNEAIPLCPSCGITAHAFGYDPAIDWIICGGESGKNARPMHPDWARNLRDQCQAASVPFFFKQWGEWSPCVIDQLEDGNLTSAYPLEGCHEAFTHQSRQPAVFWQNQDLVEWPYIEMFPAIGARRIGKARAGRLLDGVTHDEFPSPQSTSPETGE